MPYGKLPYLLTLAKSVFSEKRVSERSGVKYRFSEKKGLHAYLSQ